MTADQQEGQGEEANLPPAELNRLGEWVENRRIEIELDPQLASRSAFWAQVAQALDPESVGILLAAKEMNEERDPLTGILNRRGMERALAEALDWEKRTGEPITLVFMDLDRFKGLNDSYGHRAGDAVLEEWAGFLKTRIRKTDALGRYGGEEIVAVLRDATEEQGGLMFDRIKEDMTDVLKRRLEDFGITVPVTMSMGVAQHERDQTAMELLEKADARMYEAKRGGRNLIVGGG